MKTIREHLESIADPELREAALRNYDWSIGYAGPLQKALIYAFTWSITLEGSSFWNAIYQSYRNGNTPTYSQFKHLIR
jgi:hypothetical protein